MKQRKGEKTMFQLIKNKRREKIISVLINYKLELQASSYQKPNSFYQENKNHTSLSNQPKRKNTQSVKIRSREIRTKKPYENE